ncbi:hypothetical protein RR46_11515 [Papilio xuthus]|uniref:Uncharacterized protein n=1 Tax=Papilio xuthus TaxID=66420 RepID=A0A194PR64_PAPXU|nr:hypothetical protein RR46_11515 [Papilio xuthus]
MVGKGNTRQQPNTSHIEDRDEAADMHKKLNRVLVVNFEALGLREVAMSDLYVWYVRQPSDHCALGCAGAGPAGCLRLAACCRLPSHPSAGGFVCPQPNQRYGARVNGVEGTNVGDV